MMKHCADYLMQNISPESFYSFKKAVSTCYEMSMATTSLTFVSSNKKAILKQPEFITFDQEVQSIISSEEKRVLAWFSMTWLDRALLQNAEIKHCFQKTYLNCFLSFCLRCIMVMQSATTPIISMNICHLAKNWRAGFHKHCQMD